MASSSGLKSLAGKRALVTSGCQGIGLSIVEHFLENGMDVVATYFTSTEGAERLKALATSLGRKFLAVCIDLTNAEAAAAVMAAVEGVLGGLDILVNNTGSLIARKSCEDGDDEHWNATIALNMTTTIRTTRAALPLLKAASAAAGGAAIINLASLAGRKGGHGGSLAYATTKGAILTYTRALATELGSAGIRVNALAPGLILGTSFHTTHTTADSAATTVSSLPLQRPGSPADVARAALFLASEWSGFITGATIDINGGGYMA